MLGGVQHRLGHARIERAGHIAGEAGKPPPIEPRIDRQQGKKMPRRFDELVCFHAAGQAIGHRSNSSA
jgi:hypothetical protein